ncbi:uncharacterized protein LOC134216612 [Armigeres subalbatus]|uniref:uncharacterized protein LOC134216612 n=1 Tax=Armigeres subalbatus TaxID=124917 RepID=UPI002ED22AFF
MLLSLIFFNLISTLINSQHLEMRNLYSDPVLLFKLRECKIQTGVTKIIHPINLTNIEINVLLFSEIAKRTDNKLPMSKLLFQKSRALVNNFYQLKPISNRRHKRWDKIGQTWKWMAGSPDADDLRLINRTLNELINENNHQIRVNDVINNRIQEMSYTINNLIKQQSITNKLILEEIDALTLILYIDTINDVLEEIQDTVIRAKISLASSKLLTLKEIVFMDSLLQDQGVKLEFPQEALNFAIPKIVTKHDLLLYILEIPEIEKRSSEIIEIFPLTVNGKIIIDLPRFIVKSKDQIFTTVNPDKFVQRYSDLKSLKDNCTYPIVMGLASHCNAQQSLEMQITLISENKLLVQNADQTKLSSSCGPDDRNLSGNILITFSNCSINVANKTFMATEIISPTKELQGAFPSLKIHWNVNLQPNISTLTNHTIINRKHIENIKLEQFSHQTWIFSLIGGLSTTTIIIFGITIFVCLHRKKIVVKIKSPRLRQNATGQTGISKNLEHPTKDQNKDEDVLSLPPGGIMLHTQE